MSEFADNKAAEFYARAKSDTTKFALIIGIGLLFATAISLYLLIYTLRTLKTISLNRKQHSQIIDQNVMISAVDDEGNIFDISNRLSRFLGKNKHDVLSLHCREIFFSSDQDLFNEMWKKVNSGSTWHGEIAIHHNEVIAWLGIDVLPMQTNNYTYSGFRLLAHDITSQKSLEQISLTDALTGLLNRRSLDLVLERQIKLAVRNKHALTAVMLDVDFFKLYNDTYGHPAGDKVLTRLATVLTRMLARPDDFVFRIGGEEFLLLFNSNSPEDSEKYIEELRQAVTLLDIKHAKSNVAQHVTVSMGAVFFGGASIIESSHLLSDADDNLYQAKVIRNSFVQSEI